MNLLSERVRTLLPEEHKVICDEEERAWVYARETLAKLGVDDWDAFERRHMEALASYYSLDYFLLYER